MMNPEERPNVKRASGKNAAVTMRDTAGAMPTVPSPLSRAAITPTTAVPWAS